MKLALDLSTTATGWASGQGRTPQSFGTIVPPKTAKTVEARIVSIVDQLLLISASCFRNEPLQVYVEELNYLRGMPAIRALAGIRGAVLYALTKQGCELHFLNRPVFLKELGLPGNAKKEQVVEFVRTNIGVPVANDNEADAVCVYLGSPK